MLYKPTQTHQKHITQATFSSNRRSIQHGQISILLDIPSESLTHITCFLEPSSLIALGRTNKYLNEHVANDNTWHRAFVYQFLGISPEGDLHDAKSLMLRRHESSWRKEYVLRYNLRRRWERSHNSTITHTPHHSAVSGMLLMPEVGLLTSSIQYGIVSRSLPLTGKILRGYLDTSGTGLGIGNPNTEFTPNVSVCALSSDGGTAKVVWAFRSGEVALMTAGRAMDNGRAAAKLTRCKVEDQHDGAVQDAAWSGNNAFVTGACDGRVKLWDARRVTCKWTSTRQDSALIADPCIKVACSISKGIVVGVWQSGNMSVWSGLEIMMAQEVPQVPMPVISEIYISFSRIVIGPESPVNRGSHEIVALYLDHKSPSELVILVAYAELPYFHRVHVDLQAGSVATTSFGEESLGHITTIKPCFSETAGDSSFVIVGDQLGCISIYDWASNPSVDDNHGKSPSLLALRTFEAHEDGAVTAIAWNSVTLVTGSARGTLKVWDSLTLAPLRSFSSPGARPPVGGEWDGVGQIILERDLVIISVGSRVMAWRAGPVSHRGQSVIKGKQIRRVKHAVAKGYQKLEFHSDIRESITKLDREHAQVKRAFGREKEQRSTLNSLGLDEIEAVEYVLMLSRDEEEARRVSPAASAEADVFGVNFEDMSSRNAAIRPPSSSTHSSPSSGRSLPRTSPSKSNHKVQISPPFRSEALEARFSASPPDTNGVASLASPPIQARSLSMSSTDSNHFPPISATPSNESTPNTSFARRSISGSPHASRSAWSYSRPTSSGPSSPQRASTSTWRGASSIAFDRSLSSGTSLLSADLARHAGTSDAEAVTADFTEDMDDDLRFAIELSLVEARSREVQF